MKLFVISFAIADNFYFALNLNHHTVNEFTLDFHRTLVGLSEQLRELVRCYCFKLIRCDYC